MVGSIAGWRGREYMVGSISTQFMSIEKVVRGVGSGVAWVRRISINVFSD